MHASIDAEQGRRTTTPRPRPIRESTPSARSVPRTLIPPGVTLVIRVGREKASAVSRGERNVGRRRRWILLDAHGAAGAPVKLPSPGEISRSGSRVAFVEMAF